MALEGSLSSSAPRFLLLLGGEVTPALLKGQAAAGINSSVLLISVSSYTCSAEGRLAQELCLEVDLLGGFLTLPRAGFVLGTCFVMLRTLF